MPQQIETHQSTFIDKLVGSNLSERLTVGVIGGILVTGALVGLSGEAGAEHSEPQVVNTLEVDGVEAIFRCFATDDGPNGMLHAFAASNTSGIDLTGNIVGTGWDGSNASGPEYGSYDLPNQDEAGFQPVFGYADLENTETGEDGQLSITFKNAKTEEPIAGEININVGCVDEEEPVPTTVAPTTTAPPTTVAPTTTAPNNAETPPTKPGNENNAQNKGGGETNSGNNSTTNKAKKVEKIAYTGWDSGELALAAAVASALGGGLLGLGRSKRR